MTSLQRDRMLASGSFLATEFIGAYQEALACCDLHGPDVCTRSIYLRAYQTQPNWRKLALRGILPRQSVLMQSGDRLSLIVRMVCEKLSW